MGKAMRDWIKVVRVSSGVLVVEENLFSLPTYDQLCSPLRSQPAKVQLRPVHLKARGGAGWEVATKHTSNKSALQSSLFEH